MPAMNFYLKAECYLDTLVFKRLFRDLLAYDKGIHASGWSSVVSGLNSQPESTVPIVGFIDNDKETADRQKNIKDEFQIVKRHKHYLIFKKNTVRRKTILVVIGQKYKAMEHFLISTAQESNLNLDTYDIPASAKEFVNTKQSEEYILNAYPQLPNLLNELFLKPDSNLSQLRADLLQVLQS